MDHQDFFSFYKTLNRRFVIATGRQRATDDDGHDVRTSGQDHRHAESLRSCHPGGESGPTPRTAGQVGKHQEAQCHGHSTGMC